MITGTMDAFEQEVYRCREYLRRFGLNRWGRYLPEEEVRDLVQETLASALQARHGFRGEAAVSSWLIQILKNQASAYFRRKRREPVTIEDMTTPGYSSGAFVLPPEPSTEITLEDHMIAGEVAVALQVAVEMLSSEHREVVKRFYYEDLSIAEIASQLNIPAATVRTRLHYARNHLRERFLLAV